MEQRSGPIVVVGAGAAGSMAAIFAAQGRRKVLLLEATREGGRKILISGGGRCNVLPQALEPSRFVTASSTNTMRAMLRDWPLAEQRRFFEEDLGIPLALESHSGKLFPVSNRARDVRDQLLAYAREQGVEIRFDAKVVRLEPPREGEVWSLSLQGGESLQASAVVLATGGLSIPTTGSDGTGLRIAGALGHRIHPTYPALTPLTSDPPRHAHLSGVSLKVTLEASTPAGRVTSEGGFLFTHHGYSGPAVLDLSHVAVLSLTKGGAPQAIHVRWCSLGEREWDDLLRTGTGKVDSLLRSRVPERLAAALLSEASLEGSLSLSQLRRPERRRLVEHLARYRLPWTGEEGYRKAEVTGGGVALEELHRATLESRRHPGLFLCGEMLDAFGPIGGHNFAWAWATGRAAGRGAARMADARMRER